VNRRDELAANIADVQRRVAAAAVAVGRDAAEITVVAVTKTWPAADVRLLCGLGITDVGENRDQEAAPKHAACRDLPIRWHFVGQVQRNKTRSITSYADVVHSVDRVELVHALDRHAAEHGRRIVALVQVALDEPAGVDAHGRGGVPPDDVLRMADAVAEGSALDLGGVMAVAPLGADPDAAFARLASVAAAVRAAHPGATIVSAGMSGDLEAAVRHGATHVRVGTALLGPRAAAVG
jgi:pyridoxal phosphate enzyme (YggS family)